MHRWNEFPGLEAAVNRVNGIGWSDLQGRAIPGGPVKYDVPTFDDVSSLSDSLEEGEIKEVDTEIKKENEHGPALSLDVGPLKRLAQPESATCNQPQHLPHQNSNSCKADSAERPPGYYIQAMPQSPITNHGHHPTNWDELAHHYYQLLSPHFYPVMPYYNTDFLPYGPDSSVRTRVGPQSPHGAGHSQVHALPQRVAGTTPPRIPTYGLTPSPHDTSLGLQNQSSNLPQEPSPATNPPSASPLRATILGEHGSQHHHKRKFPTSTDSSTSEPKPPRKRRLPVASDFMSDDDEPENKPRKHTLPANGVPDFGTWFQDQVTGSKKKLSHLKQASAATGDRKGP